MHYKLKGLTIRAENAAQAPSRAGRKVLQWIEALPAEARVLDYGCGKLRYTLPLSKRVREVLAVDSEIQITRVQKVGGERTSLVHYAQRNLQNVRIGTPESVNWDRPQFDAALLANVLSAVPVKAERRRILSRIRSALRPGGELMICTQFANSTCDSYPDNPRAERYLDGWLVRQPSGNAASFYAMLRPAALEKLCRDAALIVVGEETLDHSIYLLARRDPT